MWLITPLGFYSIVCKPNDMESGKLTIRARIKSDLEGLHQECLPSLGAISEDTGTDYRFRARAKRDEAGEAIATLVRKIHYENFKHEVADKQGQYRAELYHKVWNVLFSLQRSMR
jgi:hypothetical protein